MNLTDRQLTTALVRRVARTYAPYYRSLGISVSATLAEDQHALYVSALKVAGLEVHTVGADNDYPDCVFVEDPAIVWSPRAMRARLTKRREGEQEPVMAALRKWHKVTEALPAGAHIEGGDVLHVGDVTYVGLTTRTNERGVEALRDFLAPSKRRIVPVPVKESLHLKTVVTYLGDGALIAAPGFVDTRHFDVQEVIFTDKAEARAANCLRINNRLLIPTGCPVTERRLRAFAEKHDVEVIPLSISEFEKGDGSLTCLCLTW